MKEICVLIIFMSFHALEAVPVPGDDYVVHEDFFVCINGIPQWIMMHGPANAPVLLVLHGGPGLAYSPFIRKFQSELETRFLVVNWDQRGSGKSILDEKDFKTLKIEDFVDDIHELTGYLKKRYFKNKIVLLAHSWGSRIGLLAVQKYPGDYLVYFGTGQVTNEAKENQYMSDAVVQHAKQINDEQVLNILSKFSPEEKNSAEYLVYTRKKLYEYGLAERGFDLFKNLEDGFKNNEDFELIDAQNYFTMKNLSYSALEKEISDMDDLNVLIPKVKIPVIFLEGQYDYIASVDLAYEYYLNLDAPKKEFFKFPNSAHYPMFEESTAFNAKLIELYFSIFK